MAEADDEAGGCVPAAPWQAGGHRPTCVDVHAIGLRPTRSAPPGDGPTFLAQGGWRGVWLVPPREGAGGRGDDLGGMGHRPNYYVVKTIRYSSDDVDLYSPGTYRRHQIDAMASERLSGTGTAAAIYGFCGHSVLNERARSSLLRRIKDLGRKDREQGFRLDWDGAVERAKEGGREALKGRRVGTIRFGGGGMGFGEGKREAKAEPEWPTLAARLGYARDAARLVAEMRRVDSCGKDGAGREGGGGDSYSYNVTIVHKDLKPDNILVFSGGDRGDGKLGDVLRLGDFNDAQLQWHNATAAAAAAGGGGGTPMGPTHAPSSDPATTPTTKAGRRLTSSPSLTPSTCTRWARCCTLCCSGGCPSGTSTNPTASRTCQWGFSPSFRGDIGTTEARGGAWRQFCPSSRS